nr:hypothetical protein [Tanacetum cinerariifolium]
TMDTIIDQQVALDEALVPHAKRLRIGRSNFHLLSDIKSKESTLQLVYDVMSTVHHHSIRFKMDNKKHIVNLESFREMLHICPRLPHQPFVEPSFEEEILSFFRFLGHSGEIRKLTDVNINKLHHPWRSFSAIINKCLTGKSSGYDSLRLSQAQILWGLYHKRNVDFTYLMWEDFVYQVEHKDMKKRNEIDDHMFTTIKLVSRHQNTQQFGALLPIELTNEDIRNSNAYKEYYAFATGATPPNPKASVQKTRSSSNTTITPPTTAAGPRLTTSEKGKQAAKASKAKSLSALFEVAMTEVQQMKLATKRSLQQTHISQASGSGANEGTGSIPGFSMYPLMRLRKNSLGILRMKKVMMMKERTVMMMMKEMMEDEGDDGKDDEEEGGDDEQASDKEEFIHPSLSTHAEEETRDEESVDPIPKTPKNSDDKGNGEENIRTNVGREEGHDEEEKEGIESIFETTSQMDVQTPTSIIKEQVKEQVKVQVSKILPKIKQTVNEQLEAEVLTRSSNSSKTSYAIAADLSEMELKKILIEKMEGNKSIQRSNEQRNLYKALVDAYESDKIILDIYGDTVTLKRRRDDDADKDEEPIAGSDRGSKSRREGKEPESASAPKEKATRSTGKSTQGSKFRQTSARESATAEEPMQTTFEMEKPAHPEFETGADDQPIVESSQHPEWFSQQKNHQLWIVIGIRLFRLPTEAFNRG